MANTTPDIQDFLEQLLSDGAGALALLLSSRSKRKFAAMAGLGTLGVIAYKAHQAGRMPQDMDDVIGLLKGEKADDRANVLLQAMVAAAQADGEVSEEELALINAQENVSVNDVKELLNATPDPEAVDASSTARNEKPTPSPTPKF